MHWGKVGQVVQAIFKTKKGHHESRAEAEVKASRRTAGATVWMARFTFVSVGAAGITAWILWNQLTEMKSEQRPILWTANDLGAPQFIPQPGGLGSIAWTIHPYNYGHSMVAAGRATTFIQFGTDAPIQSYGQALDGLVLGPIAPGQEIISTVFSVPLFTTQQFKDLMAKDRHITVIVVADYSDLAGNTYQTGMCFTHPIAGNMSFCTTKNYIK